jgi:hypothetical protein
VDELEGKSAVALDKRSLGDHAMGLPAPGRLGPLSLRTKERDTAVVRTIVSVSDAAPRMTCAGDVPEGAYGRVRPAHRARVIDGAAGAAQTSDDAAGATAPEVAVLVRCVGRNRVLKPRTAEEVERVRDSLGERTGLPRFYGYGEIAPLPPGARCDWPNQTMMLATFSER